MQVVDRLGDAPVQPQRFLIWSTERRAWLAPNRRGYARDLCDAGRYGRAEAVFICCGALTAGRWNSAWPFPALPIDENDIASLIEALL